MKVVVEYHLSTPKNLYQNGYRHKGNISWSTYSFDLFHFAFEERSLLEVACCFSVLSLVIKVTQNTGNLSLFLWPPLSIHKSICTANNFYASSHSCQVTIISISKTDIEEVITKFYFWYQMNISKLIDLYSHWKCQKIMDFKLIFKKWNLETMPYMVFDDKWSREALKVAQSYPSLQQCFQKVHGFCVIKLS